MTSPSTIPEHLVIQFSKTVHRLAQQEESVTRGTTAVEFVKGKAWTVNRQKGTAAKEVTSRYNRTELSPALNSVRRKTIRDYEHADLMPQLADMEKMLTDPQSDLVQNAARAMNVVYDQRVIGAAFADVTTGEDGSSSVTFANDGGQTIVEAGTGLTKAKLDQVHKNFNGQNVPRSDKRCMLIGEAQFNDLTNIEELVNNDYGQRALDQLVQTGRADLYGFTFLWVADLLTAASSVRDCIAYTRSGIRVGINYDLRMTVSEPLFEYQGNPHMIKAFMGVDAIRVEGARVQKVQCRE